MPRIGVSFPITTNSKLYFNYGHFRQMLDPFAIFGVQSTPAGGIDVIGNPEHPMPQTVAYELGFDQNLFDQFLLRVSGFYRDIRDQPRTVTFNSLGSVVNYQSLRPWNYEDVRGAEFTLSKNRGAWFRDEGLDHLMSCDRLPELASLFRVPERILQRATLPSVPWVVVALLGWVPRHVLLALPLLRRLQREFFSRPTDA